MAEKTYTLEFDGYRRETQIKWLPTYSGIYCVYEGILDKKDNSLSKLNKLIYIGETDEKDDGIKGRISNHEKWDEWTKKIITNN